MLSTVVRQRLAEPRHRTPLEAPTAVGVAGQRAGQTMRIELQLDGRTIVDGSFDTIGCAPAIAAADVLIDMVLGRSIEDARRVTTAELLRELGDLPPTRRYCADVAVRALHAALEEVS